MIFFFFLIRFSLRLSFRHAMPDTCRHAIFFSAMAPPLKIAAFDASTFLLY